MPLYPPEPDEPPTVTDMLVVTIIFVLLLGCCWLWIVMSAPVQ